MTLRKMISCFAGFYLISVMLSTCFIVKSEEVNITESDLGVLCVQAVYPEISRGSTREINIISKSLTEPSDNNLIIDTQDPLNPSPASLNADKREPLVIIYHTHATEAYHPVTADDNYRTKDEDASVREVGSVLASELEKLGIGVIHDKTLHDAESYNQSYSRSLETVKKLMSENPSAVFIIDLHRDAAAYTGGKSDIIEIDGEPVSTFAMVVGQGNENAKALNVLAQNVLATADEMYPGFAGRKIDKEYKYNQYVSDYAMLIEVGNNENDISETRNTAKYLAHVLKNVIEETISSN